MYKRQPERYSPPDIFFSVYDALQYGRQVSDAAAKHRADRKKQSETEKKISGGEYLSGFYKEDRLTPVITLVIHFGAKEWDGPLSLHEMMEAKDPEILKYVQDYRIHLIDPSKLTEEMCIRDSLKPVTYDWQNTPKESLSYSDATGCYSGSGFHSS